MAYSSTAFQATHLWQGVYDKLEQTRGLVATGGSTTTIIDTAISDTLQDDAFNGNSAFVAYDAGGAGAAPEGEVQRVSDYVASTTTLTTAAFTVAIAAGDIITLARGSQYPFNDMRRLCNNALKNLGDVPNIDTSLTTAVNQTEYNIPATVAWNRIVKVELQGTTTDANSNLYYEIRPKQIVPPSAAGGTASLVLEQYASGYTVRITSMGQHVDLVSYDDAISLAVHRSLAVAACALECARWKREVTKDELLPRLEQQYEIANVRHPVTKFVKSVSGMPVWGSSDDKDRFTFPGPA